MKKILYTICLSFLAFNYLTAFPNLNSSDSNKLNGVISSSFKDSLNLIKYKKHVTSLYYISRKTDNSKYFLNLANTYADSILFINPNNLFAKEIKDKISLTLLTCKENINHKVELFPFFNGMPSYLGFVDDPIEYAYDKSINSLLSCRPVAFVLEEANITKSLIIRGNCDDEMFEIANQILIKNVNHSILPYFKIESILGKSETLNLINGNLSDSIISILCKQLEIDRIGIFKVNDIDLINNSIWLVSSSFRTFIESEGFSDVLLKKGFCFDKRDSSFLNILFQILLALLFISLISFLDQKKKLLNIYNDKMTSTLKNFIELFFNKIVFVLYCFVIPLIFSFVMIYSISSFSPSAEEHFLEINSIFWIFSLTIVMSIIPTLLNLLFINRLDLDGFHSIKGYRYFFNTSLYASYFPIIVFYYINYQFMPLFESLLLLCMTLVIASLLARSYYQFTSKSIHKNLKTQSIFGLVLGIMSLVFCNMFILSELNTLNLVYSLLVISPINLTHYLIGKRLDIINDQKLNESENVTLINNVFIKNVLNPIDKVFNRIADPVNGLSEKELNIMILSAPMGMGKTTILKQVESHIYSSQHINDWNWYYGDCDEIQGENAVSFEPFIEAFSKLLKINEFSNRHENIESKQSIISSAVNLTGVNTDFISDYQRDEQKSITEICIDIIDKLESLDKKIIFVMEDLHWIDPESYSFLKHFIDLVNNNKFLRENLCIILTLRDNLLVEHRGVDYNTLVADLNEIKLDNDFLIDDLLKTSDFNLFDFVKHLSVLNNKFKIQSSSMFLINNIFNEKLKENNKISVLTPLFVIKVIESWIDNQTLKYSPDGYFLTKTISLQDLPNSSEVDGYYHSIFETFEPKWQRLLESAAIIGVKFDAGILAKVWGYEMLDILAFLEQAVKKQLILDVSKEDNFYVFKDKRTITAIKSFFTSNNDDINDKQIVIEYNKRYIATQQHVIDNSSLYTVEDLLKVARRLTTLVSSSKYKIYLHDLIREISIRFVISKDFDKLKAFSNFLLSKGIKNVAKILNVLSTVSNPDSDSDIQNNKIQKIYLASPKSIADQQLLELVPKDDFEKELIFICCLYFDQENSPEIFRKNDMKFLENIVKTKYKEKVLFEISLKIIGLNSTTRKGRFKSLDDLLKSLTNSLDYEFFKNYISIAKIVTKISFISFKDNNTWSDKYPEPKLNELEPALDKLHKKLLRFNNLELIDSLLYYHIRFLSNELGKFEKAIDLYLNTIPVYEKNNNYLKEQIILKMDILRLHCSKKYFRLYPDTAAKDFEFVTSYVEKRFNKNTYNNFMFDFYGYKKTYLSKTKNFIDLQAIILSQIELMKLKGKTNVYGYAHVHGHYAQALQDVGEGKASLVWFEKKISIHKELRLNEGESERDLALRVPHANLAHDYREYDPENHKKILYHAEEALDLANPESARYYQVTLGYARTLQHVKRFKESFTYFNKTIKLINSINIDDKEEKISDIKLEAALLYSNIDLDKSIPMLQDALNNAFDRNLLDADDLDSAEKILKENNAL